MRKHRPFCCLGNSSNTRQTQDRPIFDKHLRAGDDAEHHRRVAADVPRTIEKASHVMATALRARSSRGLARIEHQLAALADSEPPEWARALTALADVCRATRELDEFRGLAAPALDLEPESLPARLLAEIGRGARVGNADLAALLDTDDWQLSRAGRRLRELGLVTRARLGRVNVWDLTDAGRQAVKRLRQEGEPKARYAP